MAPRWGSRVVDGLAVVAGGCWGAVAGGFVFAFLAAAVGAPTGAGAGEIIPGFGWNRFTAFVVGLPFGFAAGAIVILRAARRWPMLIGVPAAIVGALVAVSFLADGEFFLFLVVPAIPGIAFVAWYLWRRRGSS